MTTNLQDEFNLDADSLLNDTTPAVVSGGLFDLTDVKADVRGQPAPLPAGIYKVAVEDVTWGTSGSGNQMLTWRFKVITGEFASRTIMDWTIMKDTKGKVDPRGLAKLKAYLEILCPEYPLAGFDPAFFAAGRVAISRIASLKVALTPPKGDRGAGNNVIDITTATEADDNDLMGTGASSSLDALDLL